MKKNQLILKDTSFVELMARRIFNVLIVANPYDAFMLEDDGRIDEKIFDEYSKLGLRYPPRFFRAANKDEATELMRGTKFELVICMPGNDTIQRRSVPGIVRIIIIASVGSIKIELKLVFNSVIVQI